MSESNRRKKLFNLTRGYLGNTNEKEAEKVFTVVPICDFIGFSQHKGECWNDTLQEIFLFADGLKEITQPLIYNLDTRYDVLFELVSSRLYPDEALNAEKQNTVDKLVKYITLMKVRFVTHYNFLVLVRNGKNKSERTEENKKVLENIYEKKRRLSAACGIGSAKHIINRYKGNCNEYVPGLSTPLTEELLQNLLRIFNIKVVVTSYRQGEDKISDSYSFIVSTILLKPSDGIYTKKCGHIFGFLKCDSIWGLYDDGKDGIIRINEKILNLYLNEKNVALSVDTDHNIFIMKYKDEGEYVSITEYYDIDENKWIIASSEWAKKHIFNNILIKKSVTLIRPQKKKLGSTKGGKICGKTRKKLKR